MAGETTIDAAGRVVIPKPLREKLRLVAGTRLHIREDAGRLIISADRPEARLVEEDGLLVLDIGTTELLPVDVNAHRDDRIAELISYAVRR